MNTFFLLQEQLKLIFLYMFQVNTFILLTVKEIT